MNLGDTPRPPAGTKVPCTFLTFEAKPREESRAYRFSQGEGLRCFVVGTVVYAQEFNHLLSMTGSSLKRP